MLRECLIGAEMESVRIAAFSSHSGERGIATQVAQSKADIPDIAKVTRHQCLQIVKGCVVEEQRKTTSALLGLDLQANERRCAQRPSALPLVSTAPRQSSALTH